MKMSNVFPSSPEKQQMLLVLAADPLLQRGGLELVSYQGQAVYLTELGQNILNEAGEHAYQDWWHAEQFG